MIKKTNGMSNKPTYKTVDLFGNEQVVFIERKNKKPDLFNQYDEFVDKFEVKKTTDDCYTPPDVYELVLDYVSSIVDIKNMEVIRPFYPGGDFEAIEYKDNSIVVDNPPFSIISKIAKFYISKGVKFFLFAPHLTNFSSDLKCTHVIVGADIVYENGASVKTSFLSNLFGSLKVVGDADLLKKFKDLEKSKRTPLPKYVYNENVLTVSMVQYILERGISVFFDEKDVKRYSQLDSQKPHKKAIFGSGFLMSDKAAAEKAAAMKDMVIIWELSNKEKQIIKRLG